MEVEQVPEVPTEDTTEKMDTSVNESKSPSKDETTKGSIDENATTEEEPKKNGTLAGLPAASNAATITAVTSPYKRDERVHTTGIIVQLPEIFSLKRDRHILDKFSEALDVRMQKAAFIECESEEVAAQLQAKLNNSVLNDKKVVASRLDLVEKNTLYTSNLKKETTDDYLKETYPGIEEILREKFSVFVKFSSETECRAARSKIIKEGVNGQKVHCDFDLKKDRFKKPEEPAAKKAKVDSEEATEEEAAETKNDDTTEGKEAQQQEEEQEVAEKEGTEDNEEEENVKADEW